MLFVICFDIINSIFYVIGAGTGKSRVKDIDSLKSWDERRPSQAGDSRPDVKNMKTLSWNIRGN